MSSELPEVVRGERGDKEVTQSTQVSQLAQLGLKQKHQHFPYIKTVTGVCRHKELEGFFGSLTTLSNL